MRYIWFWFSPSGAAVARPPKLTVSAVTAAIGATAATAVTAAVTAPRSTTTPLLQREKAEVVTKILLTLPAANLRRRGAEVGVVEAAAAAAAVSAKQPPTLPWPKWRRWPRRLRQRDYLFPSLHRRRRGLCPRLRWRLSWRRSTPHRRPALPLRPPVERGTVAVAAALLLTVVPPLSRPPCPR